MDLGIVGKVALVTASSSGLGKAVANALAAEGVKIVLFARSSELLCSVAAEIEKQHKVPVLPVSGDLRSEKDVKRLVNEIQQKMGGVDILVLNTGRSPKPGREVLEETDNARWEEAYRTLLWGAVLVVREIVPLLIQRGWGRVIAITSSTVKQPMPLHCFSTVFRSGLTGYMKQLANEVANKGVTVNTVCPGSILTFSRTSEEISNILKVVPVGRPGRPEEIAATVTFLASDQAGFITGASLQVDGGRTASLV